MEEMDRAKLCGKECEASMSSPGSPFSQNLHVFTTLEALYPLGWGFFFFGGFIM